MRVPPLPRSQPRSPDASGRGENCRRRACALSPKAPAAEWRADRRRAGAARRRRLVRTLLVGRRPLHRLDRRRLCRRQDRDARRQGAGLCAVGRGRGQRPCARRRSHVRIDDGDYQLAVQTAKDNIATEQATIDRIGKQIAAQAAAVDQAKAELASAQAGQTRAELELTAPAGARRQGLCQPPGARAGAGRPRSGAWPRLPAREAGVDAAKTNVDVLKAQQNEAAQHAEATADGARHGRARSLLHRHSRALRRRDRQSRGRRPAITCKRGQRLANLVPLDAVYIDANFKETQLDRLQPGQKVSISVDALPDRDHRRAPW